MIVRAYSVSCAQQFDDSSTCQSRKQQPQQPEEEEIKENKQNRNGGFEIICRKERQ
jgi:hypothetical protein